MLLYRCQNTEVALQPFRIVVINIVFNHLYYPISGYRVARLVACGEVDGGILICGISVANRLSVDCDCDGNPHEPEMADLGIFASTDPVALDQACYDAVVNADDPGKAALIRRMEEKHGIHTVEAATELGLGSRDYELVKTI